MKYGREIYLLLAFFLVPDFVWAQKLSGRAVRGRSETRARIAGISVYQWKQNTENQVKKALTKILGKGSGDGLNPFQKSTQEPEVKRVFSFPGEKISSFANICRGRGVGYSLMEYPSLDI
jgi:hypothetical protein